MATANRRTSGKGFGWLWVLFALLFAAVGVGIGVWLLSIVHAYFNMQAWEETPAKIVHADRKCVRSGSKRAVYETNVEYQYRYQGQDYTGNRFSLGDDELFDRNPNLLGELRKYPRSGHWFRCYVNPKQPAEAILYRDLPWHGLITPAGAALLFGGFGFSALTYLMLARRRGRKEEVLARAHPEEPWLWTEDWASGRIHSSAASFWGPLFMAVFWNSFCAVLWCAFLCNRTGRADEQVIWWFAIPLTIAGLWMIAWAVAAVMRWHKYGRSVFQMASVPGVVGGQLAGVIRIPVKIEPEHAFRVRLNCIDCESRRHSHGFLRIIVWQDEEVVTYDLLQGDAGHSAIPVLFRIPYECRQTDDGDPHSLIFWNLEVSARAAGLDYRAEFTVPVFKTPQSDPHFAIDRDLVAKYTAAEGPECDLLDAGVRKTTSLTGEGCRFVFPMARCPLFATTMTLISLALSDVPFFLWYLDAGLVVTIVFGTVFGLAGMLLSIGAANLWFYRSVVDVSSRGLTVTGGLFGCGSPQWIAVADIARIEMVSNASTDKLMYFDLIVVCRGGKRVTACKWLPGHRLAVSIARQIEQALGKQDIPIDA
ncbi:MAG: DUF3592 domain-containing protein [Thermoguttaceae bacterium]|jgi:hypothetical protein